MKKIVSVFAFSLLLLTTSAFAKKEVPMERMVGGCGSCAVHNCKIMKDKPGYVKCDGCSGCPKIVIKKSRK